MKVSTTETLTTETCQNPVRRKRSLLFSLSFLLSFFVVVFAGDSDAILSAP